MGTDPVAQNAVEQFAPEHFPSECLILGFTGSLGSGCTYISEEVARLQEFYHCELSAPIRAEAKRRGDEGIESKQRIGNQMRLDEGPGCLAKKAIEAADQEWDPARHKGIVLAGIRNLGEVAVLRQFPNFFLFSIHADKDKRFERLCIEGRVKYREEFDRVDEHDSEERPSYGQQVKRCNYVADVIFNNDEDLPPTASTKKEHYVRDRFINRYVVLIQRLIAGESVHEFPPTASEAFMTMAYCESARSACLKRKVGAVIARLHTDTEGREHGYVLSSAFNDVPEGQKPCVFQDGLYMCARDRLQEDFALRMVHCPACGRKIEQKFQCRHCSGELATFSKVCRHCKKDPEIDIACECGSRVYSTFVPGASRGSGKLLDMCRSLHAEENAIVRLARSAASIDDEAVLYTTTFPCNLCANKIAEVGIKRVVYAEPYTMRDAEETLKKRNVRVDKFEGVKSWAFFRLYGR